MTATAFAKWVRRWRRYAGCSARDVAAALRSSEWHHASKFYNQVSYYDPADLIDAETRAKLAETIARRKEFEWLLKEHGQDGRFLVRMADGEPWHWVTKDDRYNSIAIERMKDTIARKNN